MRKFITLLFLSSLCAIFGFLIAYFFDNIQYGIINVFGMIGSFVLAIFTIVLAVKFQLKK
jgi:hypothetical protein